MRATWPLPWWLLALAALAGCATRLGPGDDRAFEVSAAWIGGRPAVAWYGGSLAHEALFLRFADLHGRPTGSLLQLTDGARDAFEPSLQDLQGDALVAWYEQESAPPGAPARQVALLARFGADGRRRWQRQLSAEDASGRIPVVRVAGDVIHVAWLEQRADALPVLRVASLDSGGNWLRAPRDAGRASRDTWNLNAAVGPQGVFHVVFDSSGRDGARELSWVTVRDERIGRRQVGAEDDRDPVFPDIALDGPAFALAWVDVRDGNEEVYLRCGQLDASGEPPALLSGERARRVTRTSAGSMGAYAAWHEGGLELAWIEASSEHAALWHQRFDRDCRPRSAPRRMAGWGRQAGIPSLAASAAGLALAWNGRRGPGAVALLKVWPRTLSPRAAAR